MQEARLPFKFYFGNCDKRGNIKSLTMVSLVDEDKRRNFSFNLQPKESIEGRNMQRLLCETTQDLTDEIVQMAPSGRKRKSGVLMIIKLLRRF